MSKTFIITGASRGIGRGIFLSLLEQGYQCIGLARNEQTLNKLIAEISPELRDNAFSYAVNIADEKAVIEVLQNIKGKFSVIDGLINCAGVMEPGFLDLSSEQIQRMVNINLMGTIFLCREISELMKQQKHGNIINISSMAGKRAFPRAGMYCASKFAVSGFSEALYKELLPYNVKVTSICPSAVATDMTKDFDLDPEVMIQVEDIINAVNYVLSQTAGACIPELQIRCQSVEVSGNV